MSDDLLDILSGGKEKIARDPVDFVVRTVYGEADPDPASRQAVAGVIVNRAKKKGKGYDEVVLEPGQFEPWGDPKARARMEALKPDSPEYRQIAAEIAPVLSGEVSVPYDHFYAPEVLKGRGQSAPAWDNGSGTKVGSQLFFALGDAAPAADLGAMLGGVDQAAADKAWKAFAGGSSVTAGGNLLDAAEVSLSGDRYVASDTGSAITPEQQKTYLTLANGNLLSADAPSGSVNRPWVRRGMKGETFKPGEFYIDIDGALRQEPGAENAGGGLAGGFGQGVGDVVNSLAKIAPLTADSELGNRLEANRLIYDASIGNDIAAKAGRFGGQVVGATPFMMAGGGALGALGSGVARAAPAAAPALEFIAGNAGVGGNMLYRGASLATQGAAQGAGATALVHGATDAPLEQQMSAGGVIGAALGPAAPVARYAGNRLLGPRLAGGVAPEMQQATYEAAQTLPVPVPLTQGQITLAPAQQMSENALLRGAHGDGAAQIMREQAGRTQAALRGNVDAITGRMTGGVPLETGEGGALVSNKLNTAYDAAKKEIDVAYDAARAAADGAYLPAAERGVMTQGVREALRDVEISGVPRVKSILDTLDQSPTSSTFTPTDIFDARAKLSTLRAGNDAVEAMAAGKAVRAIDTYIDDALTRDMIQGDANVVQAWKAAIGKRREFGKLFEGDDLINGLTERTLHGEGRTMKVSPEDAANYIFNRSNLGFVGKKDLSRDLARLKGVLGEDSAEWGALRAEAFSRIARAGEGAPEGGAAQFSGQKFFKAWSDAKAKDPQIVRTLFTAEERDIIDQFAEVAQRATTPVKGGDNASNSGVYVVAMAKRALENLGTMTGGAVGSVGGPGGAAVGAGVGRAFDTFMRDVGAVVKARKATLGAKPVAPKIGQPNRLFDKVATPAAAIAGNRLIMSPQSPEPEARP